MAFIEIETISGTQKVRVCDYCKTVCIPSGRYCSGHCARNDAEQPRQQCENCGEFFTSSIERDQSPMYCPGCEDYIEWQREESSYDANDGTEGSN